MLECSINASIPLSLLSARGNRASFYSYSAELFRLGACHSALQQHWARTEASQRLLCFTNIL